MTGLLGNKTLVLGGRRSGKSRFAEELVISSGLKPVYLATGRITDDEMRERVELHRERRSSDWETIEEPLALAHALRQTAREGRIVLVDCLTFWVTNLMMEKANVAKECVGLLKQLDELVSPVVLVSNETGLGIVPDNAMAREFGDLAGELNQQVAACCDTVHFVASGIPLTLKSET